MNIINPFLWSGVITYLLYQMSSRTADSGMLFKKLDIVLQLKKPLPMLPKLPLINKTKGFLERFSAIHYALFCNIIFKLCKNCRVKC